MHLHKFAVVVGAIFLLATAAAPAAASTYSMTDLGSLGYGISDGLAINAVGQVTGYSYLSSTFQVSCPPHQYGGQKKCFEHPYHAFLWSNGTMTDLGTLGGNFSQGNSINLSGEVVGTADTKTGTDAFLWNGAKMVDLGQAPSSAINDSGQIAGTCGSPAHACLDSNGTITELPDPSNFTPTSCSGVAINNSGEIAGSCGDTSSLQHAVLWQNGTATDLGTLGGQQASAAAINNLGEVVGWAQDGTDADHGFVWSNGKMTEIPLNFPTAINDNEVIVGGQMVYSGGTLQNLNDLIPPGSGVTLENATAINNNGEIVANSSGAAYLLNRS